jgi:hypothetical protein
MGFLRKFGSQAKREKAKLTSVKVGLPFGIGEAEWTPDSAERDAAWRLYVELVTRISVQELSEDQGSLREALSSLYSLFGTTREILKDAGPQVGARIPSVGGLAIRVLNRGLRPFLAKWHPMLLAWEAQRPPEKSVTDHEKDWPEAKQLRADLANLRKELTTYARTLGAAAGVEE